MLAGKSQPLAHLVMKKASTRAVRLHPFPIDHKLRDRTLSYITEYFLSGTRRGFDVDFGKFKAVRLQESLRLAAVTAPGCSVEDQLHHSLMIADRPA